MSLPELSRDRAGPFCLVDRDVKTWDDLLGDVRQTRGAIGDYDAICNLIRGRYRFSVLLLAALGRGTLTVLPPSRAEQMVVAAITGFDRPRIFEDLPECPADARGNPDTLSALMPRGEIHVFTSGSTGAPVRHVKDWTSLAVGAGLTARLIEKAGLDRENCVIVGATPHQHMYGLEATLFTGFAHGYCLCDQTVFYPADLKTVCDNAIAAGIDSVVLVASPPHLRYLEAAIRALPAIRCVITATAPLHADMAARVEDDGARVVLEIYGATETGSLAWRRTARDELWEPLEGFALSRGVAGWMASAPHLAAAMPLFDEIEMHGDGRFRLLGRQKDMVLIAGKRHSLGALNAILATITEIEDGLVFRLPDKDEDRIGIAVVPDPLRALTTSRLTACVRRHMLGYVDPVFLPRRVMVVSRIPRNEAGKVSADDLHHLIAQTGGGAVAL